MSVPDDWRVTVGIVSGGHLLSHFYLLAFPPLFPLLKGEFALTNAQLGVIVSVLAAAGLFQTPVGELVDRAGAKRIFVIGLAVTSAGTVLASFATSYLLLLALVTIAGVGQPAFHPADYALLNTVVDENTKGRAFSIHLFSGYAGFALAPPIVGALGLRYGWRVALIVVGAAGLLYALFSAVALEPSYLDEIERGDRERSRGTVRDRYSELLSPAILVLFLFVTVMIGAQKGIEAFTPVLSADAFHFGTAVGNGALTAFFAAAAGGILFGGILADRFPPLAVIGVSLVTAGTVLLGGISQAVPLDAGGYVATFGLVGLLVGAGLPSRDQLISDFTPPEATGTGFGFVLTGITVGSMVGPPLYGATIDAATATVGFGLIAITLLLSIGVIFLLGTDLVTDPDRLEEPTTE